MLAQLMSEGEFKVPASEDLIQKISDVARQKIAPAADANDQSGQWPESSIDALRESGVLGLTVPREQGGLGFGPSVFVSVTEEIASACASTAMIFIMHICATEVFKQSQLPDRDKILSEIASGKHLTTLAFSERGSRSHFWAPISQAQEDGDSHILNCEKSWVTGAGQATSYVVSTLSVNKSSPTDSTLYYVANDAPGLSVAGGWNGLGLRANASAPMRLRDCRISPDARLTSDGGGFATMLQIVLPWFQLGSSAVANGIARSALDAAANHMNNARLEHLGETLSSLPTLRARLAKARVSLDAARALTSETANSIENPDDGTMLKVLETKAYACEMALEVTDAAMRICGGAAFSRHLPIERNFRDARAGLVMAPTTDVLYDFIGKALLGMPLF
jgi:alkylation response protein AidB-like acyl-CoA dehydrogenase